MTALAINGYSRAMAALGSTAAGLGAEKVANTLQVVRLTDHGVLFDGSDETAKVQAAITSARAKGIRHIYVKGTAYVPGTLTHRSNVIFIGPGKLTGAGAYRRRVVPLNAPTTPPLFNGDFDAVRHMKAFTKAPAPVVVMMGDSLATHDANSLGRQSTLWDLLVRKLRADNPTKSVTFYNRAIAGQTYGEANGVATTQTYPWYEPDGTAWLDLISPLAPDLIFLAFGMNDKQAFSYFAFQQVIGKIKLWAKVPDIVLITPMVPTLEPHADWSQYGTKADQVGRDYAAGYIRQYAKSNDHGLIDLNRMFNIVRDGRDVATSALERIASALDVSATGGYVAGADDEGSDFRIDFTLSGSAAYLDTVFAGTAGGTLSLRLTGAQNNDGYLKLGKTGGNIEAVVVSNAGNTVLTADTGIAIPTVATTFIVEKRGRRLSIRKADGPAVDDLWSADNVVMHGGEFAPAVGWLETTWATGPATTVTAYVGRYKQYMPSILNNEFWGEGLASSDTQYPGGGNGINHPTAAGVAACYYPCIIQTNFAASLPTELLTYDPANTIGGAYIGSRAPDGSESGHTYIGNRFTNSLKLLAKGVVQLILTDTNLTPKTNGGLNLGSATLAWTRLFSGSATWTNVPTYADDTAAGAGGLTAGMMYKAQDVVNNRWLLCRKN